MFKAHDFVFNQDSFKYKGYGKTVLNMQVLKKYCPNKLLLRKVPEGKIQVTER